MFCPPWSLRSGCWAVVLAVAWSGTAGAQTNGVLELDGYGSYVELPERLGEELTEATVEFWARWDHLGYYSSPLHFGDRTNAVAFNNESVGPVLKAWIQPNENASIAATGGPLLVPGRWIHVAATLSGDGLQLWVNGVCVATNTAPMTDAFRRLAPARWLGRSPWEDNGYFRGALDEVRLWSRALPASEIQTRLRHPARGDEPGLLAAWQFDGAPANESDPVIWSAGPVRLPARLRGGAHLASQPWPGAGEVHRPVQISGTVRTSAGDSGPVQMRLWRDGRVDHEFFAQPGGRFLTSFMAEAGKFELEATHGRHGLWQRVNFEAGSNLSLELVLPPAPVITGRVVALDDSPQMHVPVEAWRLAEDGSHQGQRLQQVATTDRAGRFELVNLPTGTYAIRCPSRANGAAPEEEQICRVHPGSPPLSANFRVARIFAGIGWQRFGRAEGLPDNQVHAVVVGPDGALWVGTTAGLARRNASGFTTWTQADGLPDSLVSALAFDPSGVLWVGTPRGLARRLHERFEPAPGTACPTNLINGLIAAGDGSVWAATEKGLARFREGEWRWFGPADGLPCRMVRQLERLADGSVRATTPAGYVRCTGDRLTLLQSGDPLPGVPSFPLPWTPSLPSWVNPLPQEWRPTSGGGGWIRHVGGLAHFDGGRWTWCWPIGSLREGGVAAIAPDAGQSLWVGTRSGGLWHCDLGGQFTLTEADGLPDRQVTSTARGPDGALWIGTEKGVARWQDDRMQVWSTAEGLPADVVTALLTDRTGRLWAGTWQGLAWFNGTRFVPAPDSPDGPVSCLAEDATGKLWVSTLANGMQRRNGLAVDPLGAGEAPAAGYSAVLPARDGAVWLASWSLTRLYRGSRTNYAFVPYASIAGVGGLPIASLAESPDGTIWVGTKGHGLFRWRAGRWDQFTPADGLASLSVNVVHSTGTGRLWCGTSAGVSLYDGELWSTLDLRDGLAGDHVRHIRSDSDGTVWLGTDGGLTRYRPSFEAPETRLVAVESSEKLVEPAGLTALRVGDRVVFKAGIGSNTRLRWRLTGPGEPGTWSRLSAAESLVWHPQQPGGFVVEVMAVDRDLNRSVPDRVEVRVVWPWFRNPKILIPLGALGLAAVVGIIGLAWWSVRERRQAMRLLAEARERRKQDRIRADFARELINSQEAERGRIARELHDSLGQELLLIRNAALLENRTRNVTDGPLADIAERASRSIEEVRTIAYALRPQELDRLGFVRALETLCQEMAEPVGLEVEFSADPWPGNLSPEVEINLFRVMQEALNNVVRHAQAHRLSVRVQVDADGIGIRVRDDGSGFHEKTNGSQRTGLGLRSMRERVRLVGGELAMSSQPGAGTELEIRIPLPAARSGEQPPTAVLS